MFSLGSFGVSLSKLRSAWLIARRGRSSEKGGTAAGAELVAAFTSDVVTLHGANGDVQFAGGAVKALLGIEPRELKGSGLFGCVHVADRPAFLTALARALNGNETSAELRLRSSDTDAVPVFFWASMRARPRGAGEAVCSFVDISARKDGEEEAEALRSAAPDRKLQRLLAKAAEQVARELQATHRSLALGSIDAVSWRRTSADSCGILERCRSDAARLRSVLDFEAGPGGARSVASYEGMLQRCIDEVSAEAGTRRQIACDCPPAIARALWPSDAAAAALRLLLHEAVTRADGGQPVRLAVAREGSEHVLRLSFDAVAGASGQQDDTTAVWLALAQRLLESPGGSVRHELRPGVERFVMRLPADECGRIGTAGSPAPFTATALRAARASG